ncbi:MAG: MBL fold metallo-hydrolase [Acidobacteriota bacterium]
MRLGEMEVLSLVAGRFRLDGGSMFGVVPRVLWEKKMPPDEKNRIAMAMNVLLVRSGGMNLLVDTGAGEKEDSKFHEMYAMGPWLLPEALGAVGLKPEDIHVVVNTHLHFDHAGGNTRRDESGRAVASFPNARYVVQKREYEDAVAAHERNRASYFAENYEPLRSQGRLELAEGEVEVAPGVRLFPLPGHTLGMQGVLLESGNRKALYMGDCVPTRHHIPLPWIMAYDLHPTVTLETKRRVLPEAAREDWLLFLEHDPDSPVGRIEEEKPLSFRFHPVEA